MVGLSNTNTVTGLVKSTKGYQVKYHCINKFAFYKDFKKEGQETHKISISKKLEEI